MAFFSKDFLQFFIDLAGNNHKEWFDENRKRYENNVKLPFQLFIKELLAKLSAVDSSFKNVEAKDCIFRINRDVRFSKDKAPYKLMVSAILRNGGKKSSNVNGIYLELSPEYARVYGGIYEISGEDLLFFREGLVEYLSEFKKAYNSNSFTQSFGSILGDKNKILPPHLKEKAALEPLIFNKQWYFYHQMDAQSCLSENFIDQIVKLYEDARPMLLFFEKVKNY
jgi:uncharacterized protein (TIGR02453 family)